MNTVIIFASTHHGNTKKVAEYMAKIIAADLIDITQNLNPDISAYDIVGFASGTYFHSFHEAIKNLSAIQYSIKIKKYFLLIPAALHILTTQRGLKNYSNKRMWNVWGVFSAEDMIHMVSSEN